MNTQERVSELKMEIHRQLIELAGIADADDKVLFVDIQCDYMVATGNVGANMILECEIKIEDK
ncbi:coil containing protein [Vibrio phage 1.291.O._10N.286.55.F6]|nr:coil containing protein [Vibrio phage 1.291.O._10N.286.55.F6]